MRTFSCAIFDFFYSEETELDLGTSSVSSFWNSREPRENKVNTPLSFSSLEPYLLQKEYWSQEENALPSQCVFYSQALIAVDCVFSLQEGKKAHFLSLHYCRLRMFRFIALLLFLIANGNTLFGVVYEGRNAFGKIKCTFIVPYLHIGSDTLCIVY